jgi:two-component system cell cycle response regulator
VGTTKRIILVDPDEAASGALAERLQMLGYAVTVAHEPADGARIALADPPSAVVADLWMPRISGVQLCRLLRTEPATEHVPVILRGPDGPRNCFWAERAGAADYVVKGRMGDLARALSRCIAATPETEPFFMTLASAGDDIRERIASQLDAALFDSMLAADVRALASSGAFDRLFDHLSQLVSRIVTYRWLAVSTSHPTTLALHTNPATRERALVEATTCLKLESNVVTTTVEDEDARADTESAELIILPIELGGAVIGRLAVATSGHDDPRDHGFLSVVARELGGPLRMAALVEEAQRLATVDPLTGVMNRRAFLSALDSEIARATRYGHPLSCVLLDVDHFKSINDTRGHAGGDVALAALARLLASQARKPDLVARWGGEEFVILLTATDDAGARTCAERIRRAVEDLDVVDADGAKIPLTISVGVARFEIGDTMEGLVDRADRAMYTAKSGGRNRVVMAPPRSSPARPDSIPARAGDHGPS